MRFDGLAGIIVTQKDYAVRVAYTLINKMMQDYENMYQSAWKNAKSDVTLEPDFMKKDIMLYQNPAEADKLTKIQKNLDDVKDIMHKNIEQVVSRHKMDRDKIRVHFELNQSLPRFDCMMIVHHGRPCGSHRSQAFECWMVTKYFSPIIRFCINFVCFPFSWSVVKLLTL